MDPVAPLRGSSSPMTGPRRILHAIPTLAGGGAERQLTYLCNGLVQAGWDVSVAIVEAGINRERLDPAVRVVPLRHTSFYDPRIPWSLARLLRQMRPCLLHTWLEMMDVVGAIAAAASGVPWVGSEHTSELGHVGGWKDALRLWLSSRFAKGVVAVSHAGEDYLRTRLAAGVPRYVIPNAVSLEEIDGTALATRTSLGLRPTDELILWAGRFAPPKNLPVLFEALARVLPGRPNAVAMLCGDGPEREDWERWLRARRLSERVLLPGYVKNLYSWMKSANLFAFPSRHEGQPTAVIEAMACRCPLVLSDIPAHRELTDERGALLVPPDSPDALAAAMLKILDDSVAARARVEYARSLATHHAVPAMVQAYERVYRETLEPSASQRNRLRP